MSKCKKTKWSWSLGLIILGVFGFGILALAKISLSDKLSQSACLTCHVAGDKVKSMNAKLLINTQENLCSSCHPGALQASHPSGFVPSFEIPKAFPLDWKGELSCSSCHEIHSEFHGQLRVQTSKQDFCLSCHEMAFFGRMADGGKSLMKSGHYDAKTVQQFDDIDPYSGQCLSCHSDKEASDGPAVRLKLNGVIEHGKTNHPVGVDYAAAAANGDYKPISQLPREITLPGGLVSCLSCHEGYGEKHGKVVQLERGVELCIQCHDL